MGEDVVVPEGWTETTLGAIGRYLNGRAFKKSEWSKSGRPIIRIQDLTGSNHNPNFFEGAVEDRYVVRPGDLLISWSATLGAYIWNGPEAVLNQHIFKVESKINRRFHYHLVRARLAELDRNAHGSGMVHVTKGIFDATPVAIPSSEDLQAQIADIIDSIEAKQQSSLQHLASARRAIERFRQAVLNAACSGHLTNQSNGTGDDGVAASWRVATFDDLIDSSFYGPRFSADAYADDGIPTIRTTDMDSNGNILFRDPPRVALDAAALDKYRLVDGDLLVTRTGSIGKCAVYSDRIGSAIPSAYLIRFRLQRNKVLPRFALLFLMSPLGQQALLGGSTATNQPNINARAFGAIEFKLPDLDVQHEIVRRATKLLETADGMLARIELATRQLDLSPQAVLARAFRGDLVNGTRT